MPLVPRGIARASLRINGELTASSRDVPTPCEADSWGEPRRVQGVLELSNRRAAASFKTYPVQQVPRREVAVGVGVDLAIWERWTATHRRSLSRAADVPTRCAAASLAR